MGSSTSKVLQTLAEGSYALFADAMVFVESRLANTALPPTGATERSLPAMRGATHTVSSFDDLPRTVWLDTCAVW